jgi:hypothetical protein
MTGISELHGFTKEWSKTTYSDVERMVNGNFHKWIGSLKGLEFDPSWTEKDRCCAIKNSYNPISNEQFRDGVGKKLDVKPHENQKGVYDIELEWIYGEWIYGDMWQGKDDIKVIRKTVRI